MADQIGVLHPGEMGVSVAAAAMNGGHDVFWASAGRSGDTQRRAEQAKLLDAGSVRELSERCSVVISVCPPDAAETMANEVLGYGFKGLYMDANAISPQRAERIGEAMDKAGADFVDGGLIGKPAWEPGTTWLCLSGPSAAQLAQIFSAGPLETQMLDGGIGQASALKMCFAAYTKGTTALLASIVAACEALGVRDELYGHWERIWPNLPDQTEQRIGQASAKAWRWVGEMEEITATLRAAGLPGETHVAAAEVYRRMAAFKDAEPPPAIPELLAALSRAPDA